MSDAFDPSRHVIRIREGRDYLPVAARISWFRSVYPHDGEDRHGHIEQKIVAATEEWAAVHTRVFVTDDNGNVFATADGMAQEFKANFADHLEKAATASLGRAMGALGFGTDDLDFAESKPAESPRSAGAPNLDRSTVTFGATQAHPRVTHGHGDPASERQIKAVFASGRAAGLSADDIKAEAWRLYEKHPDDLSKAEASALIDAFKDRLGQGGSYPAGGIVHGGDAEPGYSLGPADPASEAATGMNDAAEKHWIGRLATMTTDLGVTGVVADAAQRFGEDRLTARFTQAVASRRREIEERGRG